MTPLRLVIADDEPPARRKLRRLLEREPDIVIEGEAGTGDEAVALLRAVRPDAVLLDIQMPGLDGFEVLEALGDLGEIAVVFVTAYDEYAVRAFEVSALDYLLKPVSEERLSKLLERLRRRQRNPQPPEPGYWKRILVQGPRRACFVRVEEIDWIEADRNYLVLHTAGQEHLVRATLTDFLRRLNPADFARINRSAAVNLNRIQELRPRTHGEHAVMLCDGKELVWSRRYPLRRVL